MDESKKTLTQAQADATRKTLKGEGKPKAKRPRKANAYGEMAKLAAKIEKARRRLHDMREESERLGAALADMEARYETLYGEVAPRK